MWGVEFTNKTPRITHVGNTHEVERALKDGARRSDYGKGNAPEFVVTIVSSLTKDIILSASTHVPRRY